LFSHPADFTPVCTTELARVAALEPEFKARNVKVIALSIDSADSHRGWIKVCDHNTKSKSSYNKHGLQDIKHYAGMAEGDAFPYPIIADESRELATQFGMLDPNEICNKSSLPLTARSVFVIDASHKLRLSLLYPATTGRNFE
jgi:peroxiredoxin 6